MYRQERRGEMRRTTYEEVLRQGLVQAVQQCSAVLYLYTILYTPVSSPEIRLRSLSLSGSYSFHLPYCFWMRDLYG